MDLKDFMFEMKSPHFQFQRQMEEATKRIDEQTSVVAEQNQKKNEAILDTAEFLREVNSKMDDERAARIAAEGRAEKAEKSAFRWQLSATIIGALTLLATILFGLATTLGWWQ